MHSDETIQAAMELSDYRRLPGAALDGPGPVDFIREESLQFDAVSDLDRFFDRLYHYYNEKGFSCIVWRWIFNLVALGFTIFVSATLFLFINWEGLFNRCGIAAAVPGCNLMKEAVYEHPLQPFTFYKFIIVLYLVTFSLYWCFFFLRFFLQLKETLEIKDFVHRSLGISEDELQTTPWPVILDGVVQQRLCIVRQLSAHDVVMRIMRKENYMIGMVNKGILAFPLPHYIPGAGPEVPQNHNGVRRRLYLSKTLEWVLNWFVFQYMFDRRFSIDRDFLNNPDRLKKRLRTVGICMVVLSPFLLLFMIVFFFLRHAEPFYNDPSLAVSRRWSNLGTWTFRELNEVEHLFNQRLNASYKPAVEYVKQFPSPIVTMLAKSISFIAGGITAFLLIIALLDETLLEAHLFGRNLLWLLAVFGAIAAISRAAIAEEYQVFNPDDCMMAVVQHTHYMPKHWRGKENRPQVRAEFAKLFQYTSIMLVEELCSVFLTPWILYFELPECVDEMLQFVREFTVNVAGVGDVCSLSLFDFEHHGNSKYGSPCHTAKDRRSTQGKMEKSFISFKSTYPNWEPDANGKQLLSELEQFKILHEDTSPSAPRTEEINRPRSTRRQGNTAEHSVASASSLVKVDQMYWLDQLYTSKSMQQGDIESLGDMRLFYNDNDHAQSMMEGRTARNWRPAATAANLGPGNLGAVNLGPVYVPSNRAKRTQPPPALGSLMNGNTNADSRWWARRRQPASSMEGGSLFQPPLFYREKSAMPEQSSESEGEVEVEWSMRRQSFTNDGGDQFQLPFGDVLDERPSVAAAPATSTASTEQQQRPLLGGDTAAGTA